MVLSFYPNTYAHAFYVYIYREMDTDRKGGRDRNKKDEGAIVCETKRHVEILLVNTW